MLSAVKTRTASVDSAPRARKPRGPVTGASTREALVQAAMKLYADRAIGAVSLREIVQAAGQGNQSAIHYHFHDKQGLLVAVSDHVWNIFAPRFRAALAEVAAQEQAGTLGDEQLVAALVMPLIEVFHASESGRDAIRFIARLTSDGGDLGQSLVLRQAAPFLNEVEARFAARQPAKPREKIQLQLLLALSSTIFGLTAIGGLRHSPFGETTTLYAGRFDDLIRDYVHFVGRGLLGD